MKELNNYIKLKGHNLNYFSKDEMLESNIISISNVDVMWKTTLINCYYNIFAYEV